MTSPNISSADGGLRLSTAGEFFLQTIIDAATLELYTLPSKQFVTTGPAVYDCEQVSVSLMRINTGIGLGRDGELVQGGPQCQFGWTLLADLAIVRCAPTPNSRGIIAANKLIAGTESVSQDIYILMNAVQTIAESAFGGFSASLVPDQSEGGFVAATATIGVAMP